MNLNNNLSNETVLSNCQRVAYSHVPVQKAVMTNIYSPEMGLERGTIFPILDIPLGVYGYQFCQKEILKP